jgi:release factor glutamine methyltransferase
MYDGFIECYDAFHKGGVEEPLLETLRLFDLISNGALRREMDFLPLAQLEIDLATLAARRKEGVPLEYIVGRATFMGLEFLCSPDTLIPREETELLARVALRSINNIEQEDGGGRTIIDMGTGCGNIAIALALNSDDTHIVASDISPAAVDIARQNVDRFSLQGRVQVFCGDLFDSLHELGLEQRTDLVVCNPPYIPTGSLSKLAPEIVDHEPIVALDAGAYGIDIFRRLIKGAHAYLRPGGALLFEIGAGQDRLVSRLFSRNDGYEKIGFAQDDTGVRRVVTAVKKVSNEQ